MRINVAIIILFETKTSVQWLMDGSVINPPLKNWEGVWCVKYVTAYHRRNDILRQRGEEIRKRYLLPVYSKMPFCLWLLCDNSVHTIYFCCRRSFLFANSTPNKCGVSVSRWLRTGKFYPILASYCHLLSRRRTHFSMCVFAALLMWFTAARFDCLAFEFGRSTDIRTLIVCIKKQLHLKR